jgi:hypothetical protein
MEYLTSALEGEGGQQGIVEDSGCEAGFSWNEEDRRTKRQIAAVLGRWGEHSLAIDICNCRRMKEGGYPCGRMWACRYCGFVASLRDRTNRTARALLALERNPRLAFYLVTLTGIERDDLEEQIADLKGWLKKSLRAKCASWSKVTGMMWWIEPQRGRSKRWRSHIHAIVAFDEADSPRHPRALIRKWASRVRRTLGPWSAPFERDREYRKILRNQRIEPLRCHSTSTYPDPPSLASRVSSACNPARRLLDLMDTAQYCRQDERYKTIGADDQRPHLRAEDRALLTLVAPTLRLRGCTGVFWGLPPYDLEDLEKKLRELDCRSLRDELNTRPFMSPSEAASIVPRSESYDGRDERPWKRVEA